MSNTALITGASSGLGVEFTRYHASKGGDLIITARREGALQKLKAEIEGKYGVKVHVIALDLGAPGGAEALYQAVQETGETVNILINNAGFGGHGVHIERELVQELGMIERHSRCFTDPYDWPRHGEIRRRQDAASQLHC